MDNLSYCLDNILDDAIVTLEGYDKAFQGIALVHGAYVAVYDLDIAIQCLRHDLPEELQTLSNQRLKELQIDTVEQLGTKAPVFVQKPSYIPVSFTRQ